MMKMRQMLTKFIVAAWLAAGALAAGQAWADTTLTLTKDWNLVSSSTAVTNAATTFGAPTKFTSVWKWNTTANANSGGWEVFLANGTTTTYATAKGFGQLATIASGEGFWINSVAAQPLTITGTAATDASLTLANGWNLKGANISIDVAKTFGTVAKYASVWKWSTNASTGSGNWQVFLTNGTTASYASAKGFGQLTAITPGEGFWVNVNSGEGGNVIATPPVIAGTVNYPTANTMAKVMALAKTGGLFASSGGVEMPPQPGATVTVYDAADTGQTDPLATTTTDSSGCYALTDASFDDPVTPDVELPPTVPVVVSAEFKSPIDGKNKIKVKALVDPSDTNKGAVPINPLTTAIGDKVMAFVKDTFGISITKEIMGAAKTFIDLIAGQVQAQGLTNFKEDDLIVEKYTNVDWTQGAKDNTFIPPTDPNLANTMLDAATGGLFTSMEGELIDKAKDFKGADGQAIVIDNTTKLDNLEKFLASLGFAVQGKTAAGLDAVLLFIPSPWEIAEVDLPGQTMFDDRAFRLLTAGDLSAINPAKLNNNYGFIHSLKEAVKNAPPLSAEAVTAIGAAAAAGQTSTLAQIAAVLADQFQWQTKSVQMKEGVPIFSDITQAPATSAAVSPTELIAAISGKLGDSPGEVAKEIASQPHNIMRLAAKVLNQKINLIGDDDTMADKLKAVADFTKQFKDFNDLKELVQDSDLFQQEVMAITNRIYAALDPSLYGQVLSAATALKVKGALMLTLILTNRDYLIDADAGWFTVKTANGETWIEPNFGNRKWLAPKSNGPGVASAVVGQLLGVAITDNAGLANLVAAMHTAAEAIDDTQSGVNIDLGQGIMIDIAGNKVVDTIVSGQVTNYDGLAWAAKQVTIKTYEATGEVGVGVTATTDVDGKFTTPTLATNKPYALHFAGSDFVFPFYADAFTAALNLGNIQLPPPANMGGAKGFPGVSLWANQTFFNFNNPNDPNNGKDQGIDFSNFNTEKPFIVFDGDLNGTIDLRWTTEGLKTNGAAKIAALGNNDWLLEKLNAEVLLTHTFTPTELAGTAAFVLDNHTITLSFGDGILGAALPKDENSVYVLKDNGGQYFFIEVKDWDKDENGAPNGIINLGFAKLGTNGQLEVPKETFIGGPTPGLEPGDMMNGLTMIQLNPGDVYDLDAKGWSAPLSEPFGYNETATTNSDIVWLADFYATYWQNSTDPDARKAALSNSDRALSVVTGAELATVTITKGATPPLLTVTPVVGGVVQEVMPGDLFQVTTASNVFILMAKSVEPDTIELAIMLKDKLVNVDGTLKPGLGDDQDGDGIPMILDDNDFKMDEYDPDDFVMIDADNDGVPAQFDPDDSDANVPNTGGKPGMVDMGQKLMGLCLTCHQDKTENHKEDVKCANPEWTSHAGKLEINLFNDMSQYLTGQVCPAPGGNPGGGGVNKPVALDTTCLTCHQPNNQDKVNCANLKWQAHKGMPQIAADVFTAVSTYITTTPCQ